MERSLRYRLIVWDFDGTLADTLTIGLEIYNDLAATHGFKRVDNPEGVRHLATRAFLKEHGISLLRLPALTREFLARQSEHIDQVPLFPGLVEVLRELTERDILLGVLSSNSQENITRCLAANGVADLFTFVTGYSRLFGKGKALARVPRREKIVPQEMLYVGDELRDIKAARKARADIAAVTWGFNTREVLSAQQPTYLIEEPASFLAQVLPEHV